MRRITLIAIIRKERKQSDATHSVGRQMQAPGLTGIQRKESNHLDISLEL